MQYPTYLHSTYHYAPFRKKVHDLTLFIEINFILFNIALHTLFRDIYMISYIWDVTVCVCVCVCVCARARVCVCVCVSPMNKVMF